VNAKLMTGSGEIRNELANPTASDMLLIGKSGSGDITVKAY
jgi:hypothetical protein